MNREKFQQSIIDKYNLRTYGFEEGFHQFERRCFSCLDVIENENFNWITDSGNDILIRVTIRPICTGYDEEGEPCEFEYAYSE